MLFVHLTFRMLPGRAVITGRAAPPRKMSPSNFRGAVTTHLPPTKLVVAVVAVGVKLTVVSGTSTVYGTPSAVNVTELPVTRMVDGSVGRCLTWPKLLNQRASPIGI